MGQSLGAPSLNFNWDRTALQQNIENILQSNKAKKSTHSQLRAVFQSTEWSNLIHQFFLLASANSEVLSEERFLVVCKRLNWRIHEVVDITNFLGNPEQLLTFRSEVARDIYIRCILPTNTHQRTIWPEETFPRGPIGEDLKYFRLDLNEKQFMNFLEEMLLAVCLDLNPNASCGNSGPLPRTTSTRSGSPLNQKVCSIM
eukprot:TRINITY_DN3259_c0_g1_i1.p1 TRINITY_DN3259_c0_g1~~TRINITY_DN3259_c0_g1_i1.p1  ORF type:complete len:200 (+),score=8.75 TRINITY_DN3259_c0_g1_i1:93-692(+)